MHKPIKASLTNNPLEYKPGDKVIQIYPVARPFIGVVVGTNKVEGKVYVAWNGRTMQVDPEEIQLAIGTPFFASKTASTKSEKNKLIKLATALGEAGNPSDGLNFHKKFEASLTNQGFSREEADEIAHDYQEGYFKRLNVACIDPVLPVNGEVVVVLNDAGSKPGNVGVLVGSQAGEAIVDLNTGWSATPMGSNLMQVPFVSVVPVSSPLRERLNSHCQSYQIASKSKETSSKVACMAFDLFMNTVKNVDVFQQDDFKAWVQTSIQSNGDVIVSSVMERGGSCDPLVARYPIFSQRLGGFNILNETDYKNATQRISSVVENCKSAILQHVRTEIIPAYVEKQLQSDCKCASSKEIKAAEEKASPSEIEEFIDSYMETMLWSTTDDNDEHLDKNYDFSDLSSQFKKQIDEDCKKFINDNYKYIEGAMKRAGHDFWLTRNGHGAGFWDGDWKEEIDGVEAGTHLTKESKKYGEIWVYVGDDGKLYA